MKTGLLRRDPLWLAVALFALLSQGMPAFARPTATSNIHQLTADSNFIAVVEVGQSQALGPADLLNFEGKQIPGRKLATEFLIDEVLKGSVYQTGITVQFDSNPVMDTDPITPSFVTGERMMVFLRCKSVTCAFTKLDTPGFHVAGRSSLVPRPPGPGDPYLNVLQRLATGLFVDSGEKRRNGDSPAEVFLLSNEPNLFVDTIFKAALAEPATQTDNELQGELIAALVRRGDNSMLPQLETFLITGNVNEYSTARVNLISALQEIDWHLSLPIAAKVLELPSATLRMTAARSIQNLHLERYTPKPNEMSAPATWVLLGALHDPDPEVVFAAMQSLGELNARLDERPTSTAQDAQWTSCLHFWENYKQPVQ